MGQNQGKTLEEKIFEQKFELRFKEKEIEREIKKIDKESNKLRKELKKAVLNGDESGVKTLAKLLIRGGGTKSRLQKGRMQLKSIGFKLTNMGSTQILVNTMRSTNEITTSFNKQVDNMQNEITNFQKQLEDMEVTSIIIDQEMDVVFQDNQGEIQNVLNQVDDELAIEIQESFMEVSNVRKQKRKELESKINKIENKKDAADLEQRFATLKNM